MNHLLRVCFKKKKTYFVFVRKINQKILFCVFALETKFYISCLKVWALKIFKKKIENVNQEKKFIVINFTQLGWLLKNLERKVFYSFAFWEGLTHNNERLLKHHTKKILEVLLKTFVTFIIKVWFCKIDNNDPIKKVNQEKNNRSDRFFYTIGINLGLQQIKKGGELNTKEL